MQNRRGEHAHRSCTSIDIRYYFSFPFLFTRLISFVDLRCITWCVYDVGPKDFSGTPISLSHISLRSVDSEPASSIDCE